MSAHDAVLALKTEMAESIIGQEAMIGRILLGLLANGNQPMERPPRLTKTRVIKRPAKRLDAECSRIQFTPNLLPANITARRFES